MHVVCMHMLNRTEAWRRGSAFAFRATLADRHFPPVHKTAPTPSNQNAQLNWLARFLALQNVVG